MYLKYLLLVAKVLQIYSIKKDNRIMRTCVTDCFVNLSNLSKTFCKAAAIYQKYTADVL